MNELSVIFLNYLNYRITYTYLANFLSPKLMNNKICMDYSTKVYKYDLPEYMELLVNGQLKEILDFYLSQENLSYIIKYTTKVYLLSKYSKFLYVSSRCIILGLLKVA